MHQATLVVDGPHQLHHVQVQLARLGAADDGVLTDGGGGGGSVVQLARLGAADDGVLTDGGGGGR